jgi:hypothetical protein
MIRSLVRAGLCGLVALAPMAALGQTYGPSALPAFNVPAGQSSSVSIGDTFTVANGLLAPTNPLNPYNFVDVYTFTTGSALASVDTISFSYAPGISNIQIALFSGSPTGFVNPGTYNNSIGSTSGALTGGGWGADQYATFGGNNIVSLANVALSPGGSFTLEIRGDVPLLSGVQTSSYSGNLSITGVVPEPQSAALMLAGLAIIVGFALRAGRSALDRTAD